ncbi:hypothetical protein HK101_000275 [Irineochytrium annulatum]|nr:hypothetical protein HK101_000275 [Irineochytrium annulatum]
MALDAAGAAATASGPPVMAAPAGGKVEMDDLFGSSDISECSSESEDETPVLSARDARATARVERLKKALPQLPCPCEPPSTDARTTADQPSFEAHTTDSSRTHRSRRRPAQSTAADPPVAPAVASERRAMATEEVIFGSSDCRDCSSGREDDEPIPLARAARVEDVPDSRDLRSSSGAAQEIHLETAAILDEDVDEEVLDEGVAVEEVVGVTDVTAEEERIVEKKGASVDADEGTAMMPGAVDTVLDTRGSNNDIQVGVCTKTMRDAVWGQTEEADMSIGRDGSDAVGVSVDFGGVVGDIAKVEREEGATTSAMIRPITATVLGPGGVAQVNAKVDDKTSSYADGSASILSPSDHDGAGATSADDSGGNAVSPASYDHPHAGSDPDDDQLWVVLPKAGRPGGETTDTDGVGNCELVVLLGDNEAKVGERGEDEGEAGEEADEPITRTPKRRSFVISDSGDEYVEEGLSSGGTKKRQVESRKQTERASAGRVAPKKRVRPLKKRPSATKNDDIPADATAAAAAGTKRVRSESPGPANLERRTRRRKEPVSYEDKVDPEWLNDEVITTGQPKIEKRGWKRKAFEEAVLDGDGTDSDVPLAILTAPGRKAASTKATQKKAKKTRPPKLWKSSNGRPSKRLKNGTAGRVDYVDVIAKRCNFDTTRYVFQHKGCNTLEFKHYVNLSKCRACVKKITGDRCRFVDFRLFEAKEEEAVAGNRGSDQVTDGGEVSGNNACGDVSAPTAAGQRSGGIVDHMKASVGAYGPFFNSDDSYVADSSFTAIGGAAVKLIEAARDNNGRMVVGKTDGDCKKTPTEVKTNPGAARMKAPSTTKFGSGSAALTSIDSKSEMVIFSSMEDEEYILKSTLTGFRKLVNVELNMYRSNPNGIHFRRTPLQDVRQSCDICLTSLFNVYWCCAACASDVCLACFKEWEDSGYDIECGGMGGSATGYCSNFRYHRRGQFILVGRLTMAELEDCDKMVNKVEKVLGEADSAGARMQEKDGAICGAKRLTATLSGKSKAAAGDQASGGAVASEVDFVNDSGDYLRLKSADPSNLAQFEERWRKTEAVVVETGAESGTGVDWSAEYFRNEFGEEEAEVEDCMLKTRSLMKVGTFFEGFINSEMRRRGVDGFSLILKLPDWPTNADFKSKFPYHFADFYRRCPFPKYTARDGSRNLAARLPSYFVPPDLGPKMYNAYGSSDRFEEGENWARTGLGTTPIHLDMADAVNVMMYASTAGGPGTIPTGPQAAASNEGRPAAVWDIFRRQDLPILRQFLRDELENPESGVKVHPSRAKLHVEDAVHDQVIYMDEALRRKLYERHGVKPYRVFQNPGDAVFVPAGCAHQVCNFKDCIKEVEQDAQASGGSFAVEVDNVVNVEISTRFNE